MPGGRLNNIGSAEQFTASRLCPSEYPILDIGLSDPIFAHSRVGQPELRRLLCFEVDRPHPTNLKGIVVANDPFKRLVNKYY
jgi:hypothetical protein